MVSEVNKIVSLGKGMGLEVNSETIEDLIQEHKEELLMCELKKLKAMQHSALQEEFSKETKKILKCK